MSSIEITIGTARRVLDEYQGTERKLANSIDSLRSVRRSSRLSGSGFGSIFNSLDIAIRKLEEDNKKLNNLSSGLSSVIETYQKGEQDVASVFGSQPSIDWWTWDDTWNVIGEFGAAGGIISTFGSLFTGAVTVGNLIGFFGDGISTVGGIISSVADGEAIDWLGFDLEKIEFDPLKDYDLGNVKTVGDKIKVGTKWASSILKVIGTGYENFTDPENTTERAILETIGESAVKIGGGMLIEGAVAAGLTALGVTAAPAVVTGLIAVGVTWGINTAFEAVTGKEAAEAISDFVIDGAKQVYEFGKDAVNAVGDAVSDFGETISGWWNSAFSFGW